MLWKLWNSSGVPAGVAAYSLLEFQFPVSHVTQLPVPRCHQCHQLCHHLHVCLLLPWAGDVTANGSKDWLEGWAGPQRRELLIISPVCLPLCRTVQQFSCDGHALLLHTHTLLLAAGVFISGWGFFSNFWSLGQTLHHRPQHKHTARTELSPVLRLRIAFYGKCTRHGIRMFQKTARSTKPVCCVASRCTISFCAFELQAVYLSHSFFL